MTERQHDLIKIKRLIKSKTLTPEQMGSLMKQYYIKHIKEKTPAINESVSIFNSVTL